MTAALSSSRPDDLSPGASFAGYRIERLIARGGAGTLYAAVDPRDDLPVALKLVLLPPGDDDADAIDARERFLREAGAAAQLHHPNIVTVYGAGQAHGYGYIVMELLTGCDLSRYTRPARLLPEPVVLEVAAQVADALAYAHAAGVLHRDVKPANVVADLPRQQVKLTDFGTARIDNGARSRSGVIAGTPLYMSPEQLAGGRLDGRSDLYALGVMLFQLLTGRLPYEAESMGQLLAQVARGAPLSLAALRPDLPAPVCQLVNQLLQKLPSDRPAHGGDVAGRLRALAAAWSQPEPPVSGTVGTGSQAGSAEVPGHNARRSTPPSGHPPTQP